MWRLAESDSKEFVLPDEVKEDLRVLIDKLEKKSIDEVLGDVDLSTGILSKIRFSLIYLRHDSGYRSANTVALGSNNMPMFLVLGQSIFIVFIDFSRNYKIPSLICDITSKNKIKKQIDRQPLELLIHYISDSKRIALNKKIFDHEAQRFWKMVDQKVANIHFEIYRVTAPFDVFKIVRKNIFLLDKGFSFEDVDKIIAKVIFDLGVNYSQNGFPKKI